MHFFYRFQRIAEPLIVLCLLLRLTLEACAVNKGWLAAIFRSGWIRALILAYLYLFALLYLLRIATINGMF